MSWVAWLKAFPTGALCVLASSGLAHVGNTRETEWKWNTFLTIKQRFLEFGTFVVCDCLCVDVIHSGVELRSLWDLFVVFGRVVALYIVHGAHRATASHQHWNMLCVSDLRGKRILPTGWHAQRDHADTVTVHFHPKQNIQTIMLIPDHIALCSRDPSCHCGFWSIWQTLNECRWWPQCGEQKNMTIYGRSAVVEFPCGVLQRTRWVSRGKNLFFHSLIVLDVAEVK